VRVRRWLPHAAAAALTLAAGFALGDRFGRLRADASRRASFHDIRVLPPEQFRSLVTPAAPEVTALARRLGTLEAAYLFVRDGIAFDPSSAADVPVGTLRAGRASCLGKAALLVSLYRALGVPADGVRVVTGQVPYEGELLEHAWVDLEYGSLCLQQDTTDLFGVHDFLRFPNQRYVDEFVQRELFCFNDQSFAAVSQLNRLRGRHP
jgi:hypothetical protein